MKPPFSYGFPMVFLRKNTLRLMAEICPGDLNGFLFPSGGGEANEAAIRMARLYTGKQKIFTQYRWRTDMGISWESHGNLMGFYGTFMMIDDD